MDVDSCNARRAAILRAAAEGLPPAGIAARVGCARSTVYKVLRDPAGDARARPRPPSPRLAPDRLAAIRCLAEAYPELSARRVHALALERARDDPRSPPVPSASTVARVVARLRRGPGAAEPPDAEAAGRSPRETAVLLPAPAREVDASPAGALRRLLRDVLAELDRPDGHEQRFRLRHQAAFIAAALARVEHARPVSPGELSRLASVLEDVARDSFLAPRPTAGDSAP